MGNLTLKQKIIAAVITVGTLLILLFNIGLGGKSGATLPSEPAANQQSVVSSQQKENIIVSTKPAELMDKKDLTILPTQVIEITFNHALENVPETRIVFEPKVDYKAELSSDNKTIKITPFKPFSLGQGYTIFVKGNTKFKGNGQFGSDLDFHFTTIAYRGV